MARPLDAIRRTGARLARSNRVPPPISARHAEWSAIASLDDDPHPPSDRLIDVALAAARAARSADLSSVRERAEAEDRTFLECWPGEHYRLLAGLAKSLELTRIVEIGTFRGLGALCLATSGADVVTFDIIPAGRIPGTVLRPSDACVEQRLGDLSDDAVWDANQNVLRSAELIFLDGPKDGVFERRLLDRLAPLLRETGALLVVDDIRVLPMVQVWRDLDLPKLDLTSFGHWSGTGLAGAG